jgi:hypothetical protein
MKSPGRTDTAVLIAAMQELSRTIISDDDVANAAIAEAADRIQEQAMQIDALTAGLETALKVLEQIATTPRNRGAKRNASAAAVFLRTQLDGRHRR